MTVEIIGRAGELAAVEAFLARPVDGMRALVLEGEPGIGKSVLWQAGVALAGERPFVVLTSRPAEAERTLPNVVLGDLFSNAGPDALAALPAPRRHAFNVALLREEPGAGSDPQALGNAILSLLQMFAAGQPLVIAIDDDQWVDSSSAVTLQFALRRSLSLPILLLLSRRSGQQASAMEAALDPAEIRRLNVGPLSVGAIQLLLRRRLGVGFAKPTLVRILEVSDGNPFYALELARAILAHPARDATGPLAVPPNLEHLVRARLEALDAPTWQALLLVAAHGRVPVTLLRALGVTREMLDRAGGSDVLETRSEVVSFTHPLLASAVYQGATGEDRRAAHRLLATAFDDPVDRGRHLALGTDEPDEALAAALEAAVATARDRVMPVAAAELAEHSLRLTPLDAVADRDRRSTLAARAHWEAGEGSRARAIATDLLARAPGGRRRAEALYLGAYFEDVNTALVLLEQALTHASGAPGLQAAIHAGLANAGSATRGRNWAERHARAALRLADRLDDDSLRSYALATVATLRFESGDPQAIAAAERAYRLAVQTGDPRQVRRAAWAVGYILTWSGMTSQARDWLERQVRDWGDRDEQTRANSHFLLAFVEIWSGRWDIAREHAAQAREFDTQVDFDAPVAEALIALNRGEFALARDLSRDVSSHVHDELWPLLVVVLAICDAWTGDAMAAAVNFERAEHLADARGWDDSALRWWRAEFVEALLQLGRTDDADRLVAVWEAAARRAGRERVLALVVRCLGLIAAAHGDLSDAIALLETAVDRHEAVDDPFARARALLALGTVRRRARQKRSAREALQSALAAFDVLGAASWAVAARAELARIGGRERIEGLSPSELRVAGLVAEGHTNREIASELFLGERTVASHLTHVYAKLGIRSRTELTRRMRPGALISGVDAGNIQRS